MSKSGEELRFVKDAFNTNWIAPLGPNVIGFETDLRKYANAKHAVALSSGTAAIHMALKAAGVGIGDIVLCQSFIKVLFRCLLILIL